MTRADVLFEVSWEVANMVGGIHTAIASKVPAMVAQYGERYIAIGPDMHRNIEGPPPFEEEVWDPALHETLGQLEIAVRMGRWKVPGNPRCLLVNYGSLHQKKDEILFGYWEKYRLNSLFGSWDYYDPLLFAHGVGMVIERYYAQLLVPERLRVVVQCHEWMAGATVLYLEQHLPELGSLFITHATSLGRALSANNRLSEQFEQGQVDPDHLARELHIVAKHSMECVAARAADSFATVSDVAAVECERFLQKKPGFVLHHGLRDDYPDPALRSDQAARAARARLLEIASTTTGDTYDPDNTVILLSASRYEFINKGIDAYLESLADLDKHLREHPGKRVVAFGIFPEAHTGPKRELWTARDPSVLPQICTHDLRHEQNDAVLRSLKELGLTNVAGAPVHMVFIPTYLNGQDPAIRDNYESLLAGADLGVWPSLYEPWGYAPLEACALGVPSVTSDTGGFARFAASFGSWEQTGVRALSRQSHSMKTAAAELSEIVLGMIKMKPEERARLRQAALHTAERAHWSHLFEQHLHAQDDAARRGFERESEISPERFIALAKQRVVTSGARGDVTIHMREFTVVNAVPEPLALLRKVAGNLAWCWDLDATQLFERIDPELWVQVGYNPALLLDRVPQARLKQLAESTEFVAEVSRIHQQLESGKLIEQPEIAYFCMEFGLAGFLKIYSGGLGILAGDHLKSASDLGTPLTAIGLAYNAGYFRQVINREGQQIAEADRTEFLAEPMEAVLDAQGAPLTVSVLFPNGYVHARVWRVRVGRIQLFLLDTNVEANRPEDRSITNNLYGGDVYVRLRQELILSLGGVELLRKLRLQPRAYHMNEGHSAFLILARIRYLMQDDGLKYSEALEYVRHTTLFTTHTPVPAGHDVFPEAMVRPYLAPFMDALQLDWESLFRLGQNPDNPGAGFGTTQLAIRGSARANGVSKIHGEVSRRMLRNLHPGLHPDEVPIDSVTNGVHVPTWTAPEWQRIFAERIGQDWRAQLGNPGAWENLLTLDEEQAWRTHQHLKRRLIAFLKQHIRTTEQRRRQNPTQIAKTVDGLNENTLLICFARRFAPYKRASLIFQDLNRLEKILSGDRKVVLVYAGKAHPADQPGQDLIRRIFEITRRPEFVGRVMLVENYDIDVAKKLVSGADIWLNTPTRPLEASGTSGMKAAMNGCLNLSIDDGWWPEGYNGNNGWILRRNPEVHDENENESDANEIYDLLESTVIPAYYERDSKGVPPKWVEMMKSSIASLVPRFAATRMVSEYMDTLYGPAIAESKALQADNYAKLYELNRLKNRISENWEKISFINARIDGLDNEQVELGRPLTVRVEISHENLSARDLEAHVVVAHGARGELERFETHAMEAQKGAQAGHSVWQHKFICSVSGPHAVGVRVVPRARHPDSEVDLALELVRWL
ncbi:MAG TPA: alpha-glucan family phosphorylase [Polyangiaceae bacterium]|nr:alpha-glucan family phosphorylase [Polyangiaceae bacterium]